jgi:hypothetical protein
MQSHTAIHADNVLQASGRKELENNTSHTCWPRYNHSINIRSQEESHKKQNTLVNNT